MKKIENEIKYSWNDQYTWLKNDNSNRYTLLKWSDYADSWDNFINSYPKFYFENGSNINLYSHYIKKRSISVFIRKKFLHQRN